MTDFPALKTGPSATAFTIKASGDPTLRSTMEDGTVITRKRWTWCPRVFHIDRTVDNDDKLSLQFFEEEDAAFGGEDFNWFCSEDGQTRSVRFAAPINYTLLPQGGMLPQRRWRVVWDFIEANPPSAWAYGGGEYNEGYYGS